MYYPKDPIPPGKSGSVTIRVLTDSKMGLQNRSAAITSNSGDGVVVLHINGYVIPPTNAPVIKFDSTTYHFPKTPQGKEVTLEIPFKNTGKEPLIINTCMSACGCDVAEAPKNPIAPGQSGIIKYKLNTESRMGKQQKTITITYNTDQVIVITIYGEIIPSNTPH
jgi:hypothetical protein